MSTHLSPAAQFAAAAAAEAAAEARALAESASVVDNAPTDDSFPGHIAAPVAETDETGGINAGPIIPEPFLCVCPPAPPGYIAAGFSAAPLATANGDNDSDDGVMAATAAGGENAAHVQSAAAMFESAAVDSAVGSDDGLSEAAAVVEQRKPKALDLADEELFPALGQASAPLAPARASPAAAWGAKPVAPRRATEVVDLPMMQEAVGALVLQIMARSGARIDVSHNAALATSTYVISGSADAVAKAKREVAAKLSPRVTQVVAVPLEARAAV
ncbi:hypothetical protein GGF38_006317, partial [Coemansia sp. RSA 25]